MRLRSAITILYFFAETQAGMAFQVAITELLSDPDPPISLPAEEFIELTNISKQSVNMSGWWISNGRTRVQIPEIQLAADSILVLCDNKAVEQFSAYGAVLGLRSFPSLSNSGDTIQLMDSAFRVIHAVAYSTDLYSKDLPASGRSLEMISLERSCSMQHNWGASISSSGGTPGKKNSLDKLDSQPASVFTLLYANALSEQTVELVFDETIDPASLQQGKIHSIPTLSFTEFNIAGVLGNRLVCSLSTALTTNQIWELETTGISSCLQDIPGGVTIVKLALAQEGASGLKINEILFDPPDPGADYIEITNTGSRPIDLRILTLANRTSTGEIASRKKTGAVPLIFPGDFMVITTNADWVKKQYHVPDPAKIIEVPSLPAWPNESGTVLLLDPMDSIIDELNYSADWQFELLRNAEGVALERIKTNAPTQDRNNWHSAAMHAGYGTPGAPNSQVSPDVYRGIKLWLEPEIFSPGSNSFDKTCRLRYQFPEPGYLLSSRIFDRNGRWVCTLVNNGLCGRQGAFEWDGLDTKKNQLPANVYILVTEIFSLSGETRQFRHAVTIGY